MPVQHSLAVGFNSCLLRCDGYAYMGMQSEDECYCGNSYGSQGPADASVCGNHGERCGDNQGDDCQNANAVYSTTGWLLAHTPHRSGAHVAHACF